MGTDGMIGGGVKKMTGGGLREVCCCFVAMYIESKSNREVKKKRHGTALWYRTNLQGARAGRDLTVDGKL